MSVEGQIHALLQAVVLGCCVGLLYDLFRVIRVRVRLPLLAGLLDFLFWVSVTVSLFIHAVVAQQGVVRGYMIAAVLGGAVIYFCAVSFLVLKIGYLVADVFSIIWNILTTPIRLILALVKKIIEIIKKAFHSLDKWYNIGLIPEEINDVATGTVEMEGSENK